MLVSTIRLRLDFLRLSLNIIFQVIPVLVQLQCILTSNCDLQILSYFPNELQADACLQIHKIVFESMPEFKSAPFPALRMVSRFYSTVRSAPGAKVIQQGELVEYLYFVERGSMEIRRNEQIVGILGTIIKSILYQDELPWQQLQ